ncbi:hypothetical protein E2C01_071137 [Portunus trituberculatus]|uniref:Uncharacterized protein n=1 Tax=Portunus trituberculatus TaxID=210409 RepID=A0A5B7HZ83_PORTR|nr:hypothetical protein [Portunus trituberculatus]
MPRSRSLLSFPSPLPLPPFTSQYRGRRNAPLRLGISLDTGALYPPGAFSPRRDNDSPCMQR